MSLTFEEKMLRRLDLKDHRKAMIEEMDLIDEEKVIPLPSGGARGKGERQRFL